MKRALGITLAVAFAIAATGTVAVADKGGDPNENANANACLGQNVRLSAPGQLAKDNPAFYENGGAWVAWLKSVCEG